MHAFFTGRVRPNIIKSASAP